jgi:hypothetical protein
LILSSNSDIILCLILSDYHTIHCIFYSVYWDFISNISTTLFFIIFTSFLNFPSMFTGFLVYVLKRFPKFICLFESSLRSLLIFNSTPLNSHSEIFSQLSIFRFRCWVVVRFGRGDIALNFTFKFAYCDMIICWSA